MPPVRVYEAAMTPRITLADHVLATARDPTTRPLGALKLGPASRARLTQIGAEVRAAQRIYLDDSATEAAAALSCRPPSDILRLLPAVQPLGDLVWVEWDERTRMRALVATGYVGDIDETQAADRVGMLVRTHRVNDLPVMSVGVVSQQVGKIKTPIIFHMAGFWFAPHGTERLSSDENVCSLFSMDDLAATAAVYEYERRLGWSPALGQRWHEKHPGPDEGHAYHDLADKVAYSWWGLPAPDELTKNYSKTVADFAPDAAVSVNGDLRFLISLLILATAQETLIDDPWTTAGVRAPAWSARLRTPGNVFRTLRLRLPRERLMERIAAYAPPATPTNRRHRRHWVTPHVARSRRRGSPLCEHAFDRADLPHFCTLCGYREWPRRGHERGDAALGRVYGPRVMTGGGNR